MATRWNTQYHSTLYHITELSALTVRYWMWSKCVCENNLGFAHKLTCGIQGLTASADNSIVYNDKKHMVFTFVFVV